LNTKEAEPFITQYSTQLEAWKQICSNTSSF